MAIPTKESLGSQTETQIRLHMTEEVYAAWGDEDVRSEWVDGEVILMSPSNIKHIFVARFLVVVMSIYATRKGLGEVLGPELQVRFAKLRRRRVPDIVFIDTAHLDQLLSNHFEGAPDLAIEIVSPDSVARDWREKYLEYEQAGVREYWIIDPMAERMEAYTLTDEKYKLIEVTGGIFHSTVLTGLWFKPDWLWQDPLPDPIELLRELGVL